MKCNTEKKCVYVLANIFGKITGSNSLINQRETIHTGGNNDFMSHKLATPRNVLFKEI